jgi:uncharacterized protein DUF6812
MAEAIEYDVVVLTSNHSFSGRISLRDQRLSDYLNTRQNTFITLTDVRVARLSEPGRVLEQDLSAVLPKSNVQIAFEPPQKAIPPANRFYGYVRKERTEVFIAMESMEVRGVLHTPGAPDLERFISMRSDPFIPVTNALVTLQANRHFMIQQAAIMVNVYQIRYLAKVSGSGVLPKPTSST